MFSKSKYHLCVNNTNPIEGAKCTQGLRRWQRLLGDCSQAYILLLKYQPSSPSEGPTDLKKDGQLTQKPTAMPSFLPFPTC